jgi:hypothetical protein
VTTAESTQVTSCCKLPAPVRQLSSSSRSARMSFSHATSELCPTLAFRSFLTLISRAKSTGSHLISRVRNTDSVQNRNRSGRPSVLSKDSLKVVRQILLCSGHFQNLIHFFLCNPNVIFFINRTCVRNGLHHFRLLCIKDNLRCTHEIYTYIYIYIYAT